MTEPRKPVRVSLNRIQDLAANGMRFSQGDIQLFRQRGILRSDPVVDGPSSTSTSVSRPAPEDSRSNLPSSITASILTTKASYTTNTLHHTRQRHDRRHSSHHRMVIPPSKQTIPPYHNQTFEDTCSHLNPMHPEYLGPPGLAFDTLVGFRRHSESSFMASQSSPGSPVPSATSKSPRPSLPGQVSPNLGHPDYLSHLRRASTSSPIVPSPLGNRTVLYAASSPAHTLLSLPAKPIVQEPRTNHSTAMNNFKFPADGPSEAVLPPSPSSPPTASAVLPTPLPTQVTRSKRKSVPMRSPSWTDSQDISPGVIFQLPFGYPQTSKSSPALPSSNYPSPASSTQALLESGGSDPQLFQAPQSPICRNGLGIQVDGSFAEPGATHPLERSLSSMEEDSTISIGDIIMAEQASMAAHRQRPNGSLFEDHHGQDSIPTPPMTSRVFPLQIMETISEQQQEQDDTNRPQPMEGIEMTPRTPGLCPNSQSVVEEAPVPPTPADEPNREQEKPIQEREQEKSTQEMAPKDVDLAPEDPSLLPLRAQRQLSIRRQSLIPRPELDFVRGSGILPPASKDLRTHGGATILTYPVLLSDMVQVALDAAPKGDESSNESPEEPSETTSHGKRKKGHGKRRAALAHGDSAHDDHSDVQDGYVSNPEDSTRPKATRRRVSPSVASYAYQPTNLLGSPIELSEASFGTSKRRSKSTLSRQYEYQAWDEHVDEADNTVDDNIDYNIEDIDEEDGHEPYEPRQSHHKKRPVLEKLRPGEVELAMQHAREMMRVYDPARHAMKTLQPLLDAIQSEEDEEESDHLMEQAKSKGAKGPKKTKAANPRKRSINDQSEDAPKKARKKSTDGTGGAKRGRKAGSSKKNNESGSLNGGSHSSHDDSDHDHHEDGKLASPVKKREPKIKLFGGRQTAKHCEACGADDTPCWRPGYIGNTVLCNSCGLRYKKSNVFCTKVDCKYIPLKTEYASMEAERIKNGRDHLRCINCKGNVALPIPKS
ncbi:DNA-binding transcription repressor [Podila minutissima]|nr:DNA-binding transcription repressor [Podila minutissima]